MSRITANICAVIFVCAGTLVLVGCDSSDDAVDAVVTVQSNPIVQDAPFTVSGQSNVFAAELTELPSMSGGAGQLPPTFSFVAGAGKILTITSASGSANCCSSATPTDPPDGGTSFGRTNLNAYEDIGGIIHPANTMFISAVFTNGRNSSNAPPASLDYNDLDTASTVEFFPLLYQVFFVGDGMTADSTTQSFYVPELATSVSFGVADGFAFRGRPGAYDDNTGEWQISVRLE